MIVVRQISVLIVGVLSIVIRAPFFWVRLAMGIFLIGSFVRMLAVDRRWSSVRARVRLSPPTGFHVAWTLYIAGAIPFAIGGFAYGGPAAGAIATFFAVCWIWMWGWFLRQLSNN